MQTSGETIISAKNIFRIYHLGEVEVKALNGISVEIKTGEFVMITGRNGAGKSTLMHNLALLDRPDSGDISIDNNSVTKLKESERDILRLRKLGYIFQEYALIAELTALENVMLPAMMMGSVKSCQKRAMALLDMVGLAKHTRHLPSQLSGGEQQKVAIARALINDPEILFADEPTANLDTVAAKDVMNIFKQLNTQDGDTIIMVSHEPEETAYANRVIQLSDGRIVLDKSNA